MSEWRNKAILVRLTLGAWNGTAGERKCRPLAAELERSHQTHGNVFKSNAVLLERADRQPVTAAVSAIRTCFAGHTVPWDDRAWRLLGGNLIMPFRDKIAALKDAFESAVETHLIRRRDWLEEKARDRLNGTLDIVGGFPSVDELRGKFKCRVGYEALPNPDDLRLECMAGWQVEQLRAEMKERQDKKLACAVGRMVEQLRALVANLVENLQKRQVWHVGLGRTPSLYDSLVTNLRDACAVLPELNVNDDRFLANVIHKVRERLEGLNVEALKDDYMARNSAIMAGRSILDLMADYVPPTDDETQEVDADAELD